MARTWRYLSPGRAFTLVEVLAALALVGVILPVAMRGIALSLGAADHARRQTRAAMLAEAKLWSLTLTGAWQEAGLSGDFGEGNPGYAWSARASELDDSALRRLDVSVTWVARGRGRSVVLTTLVRTEGP